jgi:hypothetical protein
LPRYVSQLVSAPLIEFFHVSDILDDFPTGLSGPTDINELPFVRYRSVTVDRMRYAA